MTTELHTSVRVKVALRRSNPYDLRLPTVATGLGRTYASAARSPGLAVVRSDGEWQGSDDEMEGVRKDLLMFEGETRDCSVEWLCEKLGEVRSTENVDEFIDFCPLVIVVAEGGSSASSREKIERSSPFQRSPHLWLFCMWSANMHGIANGGGLD